MSTNAPKRVSVIKGVFIVLLLVIISGCGGDVNWFPQYERQATDPDPFTFQTDGNVGPGEESTSNEITVKGLETATTKAPIKISSSSTSSNAKYIINGGTATSDAGTVVNGDKVKITQTAPANAGESVTSTLTIGAVSGTFTTITRNIDLTFEKPFIQNQYNIVRASVKSTGNGVHSFSISDTKGDGYSTYSVDGGQTYSNLPRTGVPLAVGALIRVRNLTTNVASGVKTTLVVDGVKFEVPLVIPTN